MCVCVSVCARRATLSPTIDVLTFAKDVLATLGGLASFLSLVFPLIFACAPMSWFKRLDECLGIRFLPWEAPLIQRTSEQTYVQLSHKLDSSSAGIQAGDADAGHYRSLQG